jgi:hypothetical protein
MSFLLVDAHVALAWVSCDVSFCTLHIKGDRLCGLVVRVPGYRSRGSGSIPECYQKQWVWNGVHSASAQLRSYLKEKVAAPVYKTENTAKGIRRADHDTLHPQALALTSPSGAGRSVRSRTKATELLLYIADLQRLKMKENTGLQ